MLVLTRKSGESLVIGDDIVVTVVEIRGNQVRIGIEAPQEVPVYRKEIFEKIKRENIEAVKTGKRQIEILIRHIKEMGGSKEKNSGSSK